MEEEWVVLIGYAHVSTQDQEIDLQREALLKIGCQPQRMLCELFFAFREQTPLTAYFTNTNNMAS